MRINLDNSLLLEHITNYLLATSVIRNMTRFPKEISNKRAECKILNKIPLFKFFNYLYQSHPNK